jgi:signal transduction histidine kinase
VLYLLPVMLVALELGLVPALEGLARQADGTVSVHADGVPESLPEPLRTGVFRVAQEALAAARPGTPRQLHLRATGNRLELDLRLELEHAPRLAAARAWVAVLDGTLHVLPSATGITRVRARLPVPSRDQDARATVADPTGRVARTTVLPGSDSIAS